MADTLNYIQYLEQPGRIPSADKDLLHSWVNKYPAIPVFRVLLAAKYQSESHPDTAFYIEQAAFYVQDRKQLKNLLRYWQQQIETAATETTEEITATTAEAISENIIEEQPLEATDHTENSDEENSEKDILTETEENELQEIIHSGTTSAEQTVDTNSSVEIESVESFEEEITETDIYSDPEAEVEADHPVETEIQSNAEQEVDQTDVSSNQSESYTEDIEVKVSITEEDDEIDEILDPAIDEPITEADDIAFLKTIHKYEEPVTDLSQKDDWELEAPIYLIPEISENEIIDSGLVSTDISWLTPWLEEFSTPVLSSASAKTITTGVIIKENIVSETKEAQEAISEKEPLSAPVTQNENPQKQGTHSFDEWLSILEQKKQHSEEAPVFDLPSPEVFDKKEIQAIEEKEFTKSDIEAAEKEFQTEGEGSVRKLAAESVSFKQDMATETLAKLYIRQGKIDLAISIYQKLIEKFPEKSSYFAGQINRLK